MIKLFTRYLSIGVLNTALHWVVFAILVGWLGFSQAIANFLAFCVAATFSFFANSKWTFNSTATMTRYISFMLFMGLLALGTGALADYLKLPALITLISFSCISLVCGFIYSNFIVFRPEK